MYKISPLGGIGRRKGLKIPCPKGRPGSSPGVGTKPIINLIYLKFINLNFIKRFIWYNNVVIKFFFRINFFIQI